MSENSQPTPADIATADTVVNPVLPTPPATEIASTEHVYVALAPETPPELPDQLKLHVSPWLQRFRHRYFSGGEGAVTSALHMDV